MHRLFRVLILVGALLLVFAFPHWIQTQRKVVPPSLLPSAVPSIDALPTDQILLVTARGNSRHASALLIERDKPNTPRSTSAIAPPGWHATLGPMPAVVGARGFAPPSEKREGDKRTPSGAFVLLESYSADPTVRPALAHRVITERDAICEDPASPNYNQWITLSDAQFTPWSEADRVIMSLGVVVEYNRSPVVPGAGSGIFIHAAEPGPASAGTFGCVGLHMDDLVRLVKSLDPAKRPMIVMGALAK